MATLIKVGKDPEDIDDFSWDWSGRLAAGETIETFTITIGAGDLVEVDRTIDGTTTIARLSGGTAGQNGLVTGRIVTSSSRQLDWTIEIPIREQ